MLESWLSHEIVHTAGQYSDVTGVNAICGKPEPMSSTCVGKVEAMIRAEMKAYRDKQAEKHAKKEDR
jgi:hypothetical protein